MFAGKSSCPTTSSTLGSNPNKLMPQQRVTRSRRHCDRSVLVSGQIITYHMRTSEYQNSVSRYAARSLRCDSPKPPRPIHCGRLKTAGKHHRPSTDPDHPICSKMYISNHPAATATEQLSRSPTHNMMLVVIASCRVFGECCVRRAPT